MKFYIATGAGRREKLWKNHEVTWEEFLDRVKDTCRTWETVEEYRKLPKDRQDKIKDVGGLVGGYLKDGRSKNGCVEYRSILMLDMDYAEKGVWDYITMFFDFACCIYSTHKHTPEHPRLRLIVPLNRRVSPDEHEAVSRKIAQDIDVEQFDDTTYEPSRLMYWPSTSLDGEYVSKYQEGAFLDPDEVLRRYRDWKDTVSWPVSSRYKSIIKRNMDKQADPLLKEGIIGSLCRAYSISAAIETFFGG